MNVLRVRGPEGEVEGGLGLGGMNRVSLMVEGKWQLRKMRCG